MARNPWYAQPNPIYQETSSSSRKSFKISTKKKEWNKAAGRAEDDFKKTSKCRWKKEKLVWGSRTYDFDHKDNKPANNSQKNCYLLCKNCHGHLTVLGKQKVRDSFGIVIGYKTIKLKIGGKKSKKKKSRIKRRAKRISYGLMGNPQNLFNNWR